MRKRMRASCELDGQDQNPCTLRKLIEASEDRIYAARGVQDCPAPHGIGHRAQCMFPTSFLHDHTIWQAKVFCR